MNNTKSYNCFKNKNSLGRRESIYTWWRVLLVWLFLMAYGAAVKATDAFFDDFTSNKSNKYDYVSVYNCPVEPNWNLVSGELLLNTFGGTAGFLHNNHEVKLAEIGDFTEVVFIVMDGESVDGRGAGIYLNNTLDETGGAEIQFEEFCHGRRVKVPGKDDADPIGDFTTSVWTTMKVELTGFVDETTATYEVSLTGGYTLAATEFYAPRDAYAGFHVWNGDEENVRINRFSITSIPTNPSTDITFSDITDTSVTIHWTAGNGANRIVLMKANNPVDATPADHASYVADAVFGSGSEIGTGNYVVYNGNGSSVNVTGLTAETAYHVAVFEYNGSNGTENYLTTEPPRGNESTTSSDPEPLTNKALYFNGVNNYGSNSATSGIPTGNADYSWEIWVNAASTTGNNRIIFSWGKHDADHQSVQIGINELGKVIINHWADDWTTSYTLPLNQWVHLAGTYDGTKDRLYVNGVFSEERTVYPLNIPANAELRVGDLLGGVYDHFFHGAIRDFRIWSAVLDEITILEWKDQTLTDSHPNYANLVSYFKMDDGSGSQLSDAKGNNHLTLHNVPLWFEEPLSVTYNGNEAEDGVAPEDNNDYLFGGTVTVVGNTGNLTKTGHAFNGWNTAADGNGNSYQPGDEFTMGVADVVLYAQWAVCSNPVGGGEIASSQTICYNTAPAAFTSVSLPVDYTGTLEYLWQMTIDGENAAFEHWDDIQGTHTFTYDHIGTITQTTWFRRLARVTCGPVGWASATASNVVKITINALPVVTCPDDKQVCIDAAVITLADLEKPHPAEGDFNILGDATVITEFNPSVAGTGIHTIIYTYTDSNSCTASCVFTITVEPLAVAGTLTKHPDQPSVANGTPVSATLTAGSGGKEDELQYRTHDGANWSAWADYSAGVNISSTDKTQIEIQTRRLGDACLDSEHVTVSWFNEDAMVFNPNQGTYHNLIQLAIDNAADGDKIRIKYGTYPENINTFGKGGLTLRPGFSEGIVTVTGTFTLTANDKLQLEIFGSNNYDRFIIEDNAFINGARLTIILVGDYKPIAGTQFIIFTAPNNPGRFTSPALIKASGNYFILSYEESAKNGYYSVVLTAVAPLFKMKIRQTGGI